MEYSSSFLSSKDGDIKVSLSMSTWSPSNLHLNFIPGIGAREDFAGNLLHNNNSILSGFRESLTLPKSKTQKSLKIFPFASTPP